MRNSKGDLVISSGAFEEILPVYDGKCWVKKDGKWGILKLELNGIDSKVYSGYALGMGIERITNLKYQVKDLRMFSENDTRFLKEFESAY